MRVCLIPAAGASSRMRGGDKLLEDVDGSPCLRALAERVLAAEARCIVTVPSADHTRAVALAGSGAQVVVARDWAIGMSASLKAGVAKVPKDASGLMILPGDMPDIQSSDIQVLWEVFERDRPVALQATTQSGARGHPIIFSAELLPEFDELSGDAGAFRILQRREDLVQTHPLNGNRARLDLDTPEAWSEWRRCQKNHA